MRQICLFMMTCLIFFAVLFVVMLFGVFACSQPSPVDARDDLVEHRTGSGDEAGYEIWKEGQGK